MNPPFQASLVLLFAGVPATACDRLPECGDVATVDPDVHTVVHLRWETSTATVPTVGYGTDRSFGMEASVSPKPKTDHEVTLLGLPPLEEVHFRIVSPGEEACEGSIRTGNLPSDLPGFEITTWEEDLASSEPYLGGAFIGEPPALFVLDREGRYLWYRGSSEVLRNLEMFLQDGTTDLVYNQYNIDHGVDDGYIFRTDWTGADLGSIRTPLGHHTFTDWPDGTLAYIAGDVRDWYDEEKGQTVAVVGDALTEVDPDGESRVVFSSWDWLEVRKSEDWDSGFYPQGKDWTHGNGLHSFPDRGTYLLSLGHQGTVVEVDRATGEPLRMFGQDGYGFASGTEPFADQHDPTWTDDGTLLLFSTPEGAGYSQGVEYAVDDETGTLRQIWQHGERGGLKSQFLGQARRLSNGNTLVNFGSAGVIREVTPDGEIAWELVCDAGSYSGQVQLFSDFYNRYGAQLRP